MIVLKLFLGIPFFKDVNQCSYYGKTFEDNNQHALIRGTEKAITHYHNALNTYAKNLCIATSYSTIMGVYSFGLTNGEKDKD